MKVLFLTYSTEDYLADSLLHGFRELYGSECVDYPKCEILYKNCPDYILNQVRGKGFTLYSGLLDDIPIDRFNIEEKVKHNYFDLIVFGNIQRQYGWFTLFRPWLNSKNTIILDGEDTTQPYPARGLWWRRPYYWFLPKAHKDFLYFKREWVPDTHFYLWMRLLPKYVRKNMPQPETLRKIAFSIPRNKIITYLPEKKKKFTTHIVDSEISNKILGSSYSYAFNSEIEYYKDIQESFYGITTKRAGWDCLRHYEIAANGAVICFKNLEDKPTMCAPHGLVDGENCISYKNYVELCNKIDLIDGLKYNTLQRNSLEWVKKFSTIQQVKNIMNEK